MRSHMRDFKPSGFYEQNIVRADRLVIAVCIAAAVVTLWLA